MFYLGTTAVAAASFVFCSFWIYHYVDLEHGAEEGVEAESETSVFRMSWI